MRCSLVDNIGEDYLVFDCIIKHDKWGICSSAISRELKISIYKVRKSLRSLRSRGWIIQFVKWYGRDNGYGRLYKLSDKARKIEEGETK